MIKLYINNRKTDKNGNGIYNVKILLNGINIASDFTRKVLKNGTVNIKNYKSNMINEIKDVIKEKFSVNKINVIDKIDNDNYIIDL